MAKVREMLRNGGYRTIAQFGEELDYYEKTKADLMISHTSYKR